MNRLICSVLISISFLILFLVGSAPLASPAFATFDLKGLQGYGINPNPGITKPEALVETIIVNVINLFFTIGGIGVVVYFVWGTVDWILSGGDKEKVSNARKKMTHALIGLALLSLSFVLMNLIGQIIGFNPLGYLQLRSLDSPGNPQTNQ